MWFYPKVLAHRGGGILAPENTLAALRCGAERGFRGVEIDAMLAADGVPVLMHDPVFGRTVPGRGKVARTPAAELQRMDAGAWFGEQFAGEPVPTLEAAIGLCQARGLWMNIEIKPTPGADIDTGYIVARETARLYRGPLVPAQLPLLSSFSFDALHAAKESAPHLPRALLVDRLTSDWYDNMTALGAVAVHINQRHLHERDVQAIKAAGFAVFCYTVNDPARAKLLQGWGVDAFCTDRLDLIRPDFF